MQLNGYSRDTDRQISAALPGLRTNVAVFYTAQLASSCREPGADLELGFAEGAEALQAAPAQPAGAMIYRFLP